MIRFSTWLVCDNFYSFFFFFLIVRQFLFHDLILLENQVPWMVLERLFNMTMDSEHHMPLIKLATRYFETTFLSTPPPMHQTIEDIKHIPDLIRKWMLPSTVHVEQSPPLFRCRGKEGWQPMPSATSLEEAGIKFIRGTTSKSILDIKFNDDVLEIPPLLIQETRDNGNRVSESHKL
jgi:hypothetical protein